ncbi:hypothetical protein JCM19241_2224 [Vibrio ishigakensis]|uniref:Uncharacterized protein n=1 Tax=Vibrio ishigakensis TaxID=1481914 RepID=A0A0B8QDP6_9VIBR|nr:hypothetical protein JCM19241_2224 [Vibrio ishigakensis]
MDNYIEKAADDKTENRGHNWEEGRELNEVIFEHQRPMYMKF